MLARSFLIIMAAGATLVMQPAPANGRQAGNGAVAPRTSHVAAERLEREAAALFTMPKRYGKAARILVRAAGLRFDADSAGINDLIVAALLFDHAREHTHGERIMRLAADRALRTGHLVKAAHAFVDVAYFAARRKDKESVIASISAAQQLASSPHLLDDDRRILELRIANFTGGGTQLRLAR